MRGKAARKVVPLRAAQDDAALVEAIRAGRKGADAALYDRHAPYVRRVLLRVLGRDGEFDDALQEVFVRALSSLHRLDDPSRVRAWLASIAVVTAKDVIRRRKRRSWLRYFTPERVPEVASAGASNEAREELRAVYAILDEMNADERIVFALRFIEKMTLEEVADACGVSLATGKRRLKRAREEFAKRAASHDALRDRVKS